MRPVRWTLVAITIPVLLWSAAPAAAQRPAEGQVRVAVNPYVGVLFMDDGDLQDEAGLEVNAGPILGGRLGVAIGEDWRVEGAYGWSTGTVEESEFQDFPVFEEDVDLSIHLFYGAVDYLISSNEAPTRLLLSAGAGVLMIDPEEGESDADFMVTLGAGFTHPVNEWITVRGEARDHIAFCAAPERDGEFSFCFEDEPLHNFEVSAGLEFWVF